MIGRVESPTGERASVAVPPPGTTLNVPPASPVTSTVVAAATTVDVTGDAGGTFKVVPGGGTATLALSPVGLSTLPIILSGAPLTVQTLNLRSSNPSGTFLTDSYAS